MLALYRDTSDPTHKKSPATTVVPEYLIVDPDEQVGLLLRLEKGRYEEAQRVAWGTLVGLLGERLEITVD